MLTVDVFQTSKQSMKHDYHKEGVKGLHFNRELIENSKLIFSPLLTSHIIFLGSR